MFNHIIKIKNGDKLNYCYFILFFIYILWGTGAHLLFLTNTATSLRFAPAVNNFLAARSPGTVSSSSSIEILPNCFRFFEIFCRYLINRQLGPHLVRSLLDLENRWNRSPMPVLCFRDHAPGSRALRSCNCGFIMIYC